MGALTERYDNHLNRRHQDEAGRRRNIQDGLRGEMALADLLIEHGVGFQCPPKGSGPDGGDCVVTTPDMQEVWSVKSSRMGLPVLCADQARQRCVRYVFFSIHEWSSAPHKAEPIGIITKRAFSEAARLVTKGAIITPGGEREFGAHYDLYVCDQEDLTDLVWFVERLAKGEAA